MKHHKSVVVAIALLVPARAIADWHPPANADPSTILNEARTDTRAGRYEDALAKQLWFHNHALDHGQSLDGVRLSGALMSWYDLGKKYPPAMKKLKETRDQAEKRVLGGKDDIWHAFMDMVAINEHLGEEAKTVAVFVRLDKESPKAARRVYDLAQRALVKAKKFGLCGKYLEPKESFSDMVMAHRAELEIAAKETNERLKDYAERKFLDEAANLIALLVLNDRKNEAEKIAEEANRISKHPAKKAVIDAALQGKPPEGLVAH